MNGETTIHQLEARLQNNPKSLLFARLADLYLRQGRVDEAITLCLNGLEHHPYYVTGNYILGKAYIAQGNHEKAEETLKKVLSHDRQHLGAHKLLGDLMAKMGWEHKAVIHYREIPRLDPLHEKTRRILTALSPKKELPDEMVSEQDQEPEQPVVSEEGHEYEEEKWIDQLDEIFSEETPDTPQDVGQQPTSDLATGTPEIPEGASIELSEDKGEKVEPPLEEKESVEASGLYQEDVPIEKYEDVSTSVPPPREEESTTPEKTPAEEPKPETSPPTSEEETTEESAQQDDTRTAEDKKDKKIVTPTLGEIYTAQKQYSKAIRVYEILLKKHPEEEKYQQKIEELKKKLDAS